jgi:hypothetical protein
MSEIGERITNLLGEEMDRKHFLQLSGAIFLAAFGISGLISAIISKGASRSTTTGTFKGYGSSKFGKS